MRLTITSREAYPHDVVTPSGVVRVLSGTTREVEVDDAGLAQLREWLRQRRKLDVLLPDGTPLRKWRGGGADRSFFAQPVEPAPPAPPEPVLQTPPEPAPQAPPEPERTAFGPTDDEVGDYADSHTVSELRDELAELGILGHYPTKVAKARAILQTRGGQP